MSTVKKGVENLDLKSKGISTLGNAITGDDDHLYRRLKESFKNATSVDIIVAFLMESGVKLIINDLKEAINNGVKIRILTGNYLGITEPWALRMLKAELGDKIDLRFYSIKNKSFHPKSYIFHGKGNSEIYVGSSNISFGALTSSIEWNYRFDKNGNEQAFNTFYDTFEDLFLNKSIIITDEVLSDYTKSWKRPKVYRDIEKLEEEEEEKVVSLYQPKGAQIEALYNLEKSREEGFDKGLVVAATGIGKTYLAAFDSFKYGRVLFLAHREEIIKQAAQSFKNVRNTDDLGFFYGNQKENDKSLVFALVQTLGKEEYLNESYFDKDYFDYIVVDEFHHAVSSNYEKVLNYFKPKFLLGLTATPERLDSQDVFGLCDYNLVYEVRLKDAIDKGWLVPFRYYGIYDETVNYEEVEFKNGKYVGAKLEEALMLNKRAELILKHYKKYNSKRAMGFCSTKKHAEFMAKYFAENGVKAVAVYSGESGEYTEERQTALNGLSKGEISVIFSVDIFNEGLDIPSIDMVMFLRPTESPTVFLQQLGRGLRKFRGKEYLNVLDFIGNYKRADLIPFLLSGKPYNKVAVKRGEITGEEYPEDCIVDFDFRIVDIFKTLAQKEMNIKDRVIDEYFKIKDELGYSPSRVEFYRNIDDDIYNNIKSKAKLNPFKNYLGFLKEIGELSREQEELVASNGADFINMIETTAMSKTYKMPIFLALYNGGSVTMEADEEQVYKAMYDFYHKGSNKVDMLRDKGTKDFEAWDKSKYIRLAKDNPIKFLLKSSSDYLKASDNGLIGIKEEFKEATKLPAFSKEMKDAIMLRTEDYYKTRMFKEMGEEK